MKILDSLTKEAIITDLRAKTKKGVFEELVDVLIQQEDQIDRAQVVKALLERERLGSTAIGDGIVIPHGKIKGIDRMRLAFGRSTPGINFAAMDGKPVRLIFLLLAPENCAGSHLQPLAKISKLLKNETIRLRLENAAASHEVYAILQEIDAE